MIDDRPRCPWCGTDPLYVAYHDTEWGVPVRDDRALFEKLVLEGFQAGLSWITILRKREAFRAAFDDFAPERIAAYGPEKLAALADDPGIVRNRLKIDSTVANARAWLAVMEAGPGFADLVWGFVDGRTVHNVPRSMADVPAETAQSRAMSRELKRRGFKFCGPTICYAFMQSMGLVDDHLVSCFRRAELAGAA